MLTHCHEDVLGPMLCILKPGYSTGLCNEGGLKEATFHKQ